MTWNWAWGEPQIQMRGDGRGDTASVTGSGWALGFSGTLPCLDLGGPHGFTFDAYEGFPVVENFPDLTRLPEFAEATGIKVYLWFYIYFSNPAAVSYALPCTFTPHLFPSSAHIAITENSGGGPVALNYLGEPKEMEWVNGELIYADSDNLMGWRQTPWPTFHFVLYSGFFHAFSVAVGMLVSASYTDAEPPPIVVDPDPPPPATQAPPLPTCQALERTPSTVTPGDHQAGVVPLG